ncbi:hypothetical protein Naga_101225g1 [Nannochloropsis gaditana]|uniref:Uncharacterized protein n=1 Tax=Nannochloropsis gaditana TaxID=72520 RepID=W7TUV4_9STRA|nr:hypothetical protein Naga_101225g1 [Nannochloropsis gaditana]
MDVYGYREARKNRPGQRARRPPRGKGRALENIASSSNGHRGRAFASLVGSEASLESEGRWGGDCGVPRQEDHFWRGRLILYTCCLVFAEKKMRGESRKIPMAGSYRSWKNCCRFIQLSIHIVAWWEEGKILALALQGRVQHK